MDNVRVSLNAEDLVTLMEGEMVTAKTTDNTKVTVNGVEIVLEDIGFDVIQNCLNKAIHGLFVQEI